MRNYNPLAAQYPHCIRENFFSIETLRNSVLEVIRSGIVGDEDLYFSQAKVINILNIALLPTKKSTEKI